MNKKLQKLRGILTKMESALVAYSGGVDSTLLLGVAKDVLKNKVLAVTVNSLLYPCQEIRQAKTLARDLKVKHLTIKTNELTNPRFINNPQDRCYWCKRKLFGRLKKIARENKLR